MTTVEVTFHEVAVVQVDGHEADDDDWMDIRGHVGIYTPAVADVGYYLRATVTYTDRRLAKGKTAIGMT